MNLLYPACLLASIGVVSVLAFAWEHRKPRNVVDLNVERAVRRHPSNVTAFRSRDGAKIVRINSGGHAS